MQKVENVRKEITFTDSKDLEDAKVVLFSCGSTVRSMKHAAREARQKGMKVGWLKTSTIWPFPDELFQNLPGSVETILVCEMNLGMLVYEVRRAAPDRLNVESVAIANGLFITPGEILSGIESVY